MISAGPFLHACTCASGSLSHCCEDSHLKRRKTGLDLCPNYFKATELESNLASWIVGRWDRGKKKVSWGTGNGPSASLPHQSEEDGVCLRGAGLPTEGLATEPSDQKGQ